MEQIKNEKVKPVVKNKENTNKENKKNTNKKNEPKEEVAPPVSLPKTTKPPSPQTIPVPMVKPVIPKMPEPKRFPDEKSQNMNTRKFKNIESSGDKYCLDDKLPCRLTKKEMCDKIIYHFIVRNNLIAAITSVVPVPNRSGELQGSFVYNRLKSLEKGAFCLPPYYSDIQDDDENIRIQKILKFLNILDDCPSQGGYLLKLSPERMKELMADEKLGRKYFDFGRKINIFYQESLINLYDILETLQNNTSLSTASLNEISASAKHIIDELYIKTQFNYLLAVLVVLDFSFVKNQKELDQKRSRVNKIIKEDFRN